MSEKYTNLNGVSLSDSYADFIESVGIISVKEIYGKYKIHHDKTRRAVRSGFLNAVHTDSGKKCQYFIIRDELYHAFIEKHCNKKKQGN